MIKKSSSNYRWYILFLSMLAYAVIAGSARMCMPVLFKEIGDNLSLDVVALGTVWGMDPLAGVFVGLPSGLLADRFGTKRTIAFLCIMAGFLGALRGFSTNFLSLAATMFLFGLMSAALPSVVPKVTAEWFSGKYLGIANALLNVLWAIGSMIATQFSATTFSPALGGWRNVMFLYGAPALLLGLLWVFTGREPTSKPKGFEPKVAKVPFREAILHVMRIKEVWIVGLVTMMLWGASMGYIGYLPLYLRNIGWEPTVADSTMTILSFMMMLGSIPMVLISDRLHTRKWVLVACIASVTIFLALMPFVNTTWIWILLIVSSFLRAGTNSLFNVILLEIPEVGATYGGTAIGMANTISMIGAFLAPPIGNSLEQYGVGMPFLFWAFLSLLSLGILFVIKEKKKKKPEFIYPH
ncbi:MAG: MFS transporter [Dehalococcoidales bacterium]|nr:MFS transporter [Dehalococcoidales bacterium]